MNKQLQNCVKFAIGWINSNFKLVVGLFFYTTFLVPVNSFGTNPPKVVKQKTIDNTGTDQSTTPGPDKDWLFATIEDEDDKGHVSCGFADHHKPSVVKMTSSLDFIWRQDFDQDQAVIDESNVTWTLVDFDGSARCSDLIQVGNYYYVIGFSPLERPNPAFPSDPTHVHYIRIGDKPLLFKYSKDGVLESGFPKTYGTNGWYSSSSTNTYTNDKNQRANAIAFDYSNDKIYIVGNIDKNISGTDVNFVWAAVIETTTYTITTQTDFSGIHGVYWGITPVYANGSTYTKKPKNGTDAPAQFAFCGRKNTTATGTNLNQTMTNALISRCDPDLITNINHIERDAPSTGYLTGSGYDRGTGISTTCPTETLARNSNDQAISIIQLPSGNLAVSIEFNIYFGGASNFFNPGALNVLCTDAGPTKQDREQIIDCDGFIDIIGTAFTLTSPSILREEHVAHLDGDDYLFVIKSSGNTTDEIIAVSTITAAKWDAVKSLWESEDQYLILKYDPNLSGGSGNRKWAQNYWGTSGDYVCGYSITPTYKGGILAVGNNGTHADNYDWLLLGRDCETNIIFASPPNLGPNMTDGKTYSIQQALSGTSSTTMSMWSSRTIYAQVRVESGFTLQLLDHGTGTGCELSFLNNENVFDSAHTSEWQYGVIVESGAVLEMQPNTIMTSNTGCGNTVWGGVLLENSTTTNGTNGGKITMNEAKIENARTGVTVNNGGIIQCQNNPVVSGRTTRVNFKNCRRAVNLGFWTSAGSSWSYFKYVNFLGDNPINEYNGAGIKDFISLWDFNGLKMWGCSFKNTYSGTYFDNSRGSGITSFNINAQIIKGSNTYTTSGACTIPTGNTNLFEGLDVGIWNGGNGSSNEIYIQGNEFKNVANGVYAGTGKKLQLYDNDFYWDGGFLQPVSGHPNHHVKAIHTANVDGLIFDENRINAKRSISPYTGMYLENVTDLSFPSLIYRNKTWNDPGIGTFGTAMINSNTSNTALDFICNEYINMQQDWSIEGTGTTAFRSSVGNGSLGNSNKWSKPYSGPSNIIKLYTPTINYYSKFYSNSSDINTPNDLVSSGNVIRLPTSTERDCNPSDPCTRYETEGDGEHSGEMRVSNIPAYEEALDALNKGDLITARDKANLIEKILENNQKIELLNILIPIFEEHRQFNMNTQEKEALTMLAIGIETENEYARNVLTFFAEMKFSPSPKSNLHKQGNLTTSISKNNDKQSAYLIYPNPTSNSINIQFPNEINNENNITFTNIMGVKVLELNNAQSNQVIDLSEFANGVYILTITHNGQKVYTTMISKI